jgi:hypothetical protein
MKVWEPVRNRAPGFRHSLPFQRKPGFALSDRGLPTDLLIRTPPMGPIPNSFGIGLRFSHSFL